MNNNSLDINQLRLKNKKICLTIDFSLEENEVLDRIAFALNLGVQMVQLNEHKKSPREIIKISKKIRELCSLYDALFIINDRIDIAQIVSADGVHLEEDGIDIKSAKELLEENYIIGTSVKSETDAIQAIDNKADYITVNFSSESYEIPTFEEYKDKNNSKRILINSLFNENNFREKLSEIISTIN